MLSNKLEFVFQSINDMIRFAEAKNAVLLTLQGAGIATLIQIMVRERDLNLYFSIYLICGLLFLSIGLIVNLLSFFPIMENESKAKDSTVCDALQDNLLFYGHIQRYTIEEYLSSVKEQYGNPDIALTKYEKDLVCSIQVNSDIAYRKYTYFRISLGLVLMALLTPVICALAFLVAKQWRKKSKTKVKGSCSA